MTSTHFSDPNKTDLSKAVLTLTKHKQRLEEEQLRLVQQMARTQEELDTSQQDNELLRSKLTAAEKSISDLQQKSSHSLLPCHPGEDRGGGTLPNLGHQMLKGLSSFVTAPENSVAEQTSLISSSVASGSIDVGRLAEENENLHRKLFELRSKNDSIIAEWKRQTSEKEKTKLGWEHGFSEFRQQVEDLQSLCARLRHESIVDKSMLCVFEHFFKLSVTEIVFPQGVDKNSISPQDGKTSSGSLHHLASQISATLDFSNEPVSSPSIVPSKENEVVRTIRTANENKLKTVLEPCVALPEQMPLDSVSALSPASLSSVHISLQLPFSSDGLDAATLGGKDTLDSITSCTFYNDKFIRIGGAVTIWITTLKKLLPLENQRTSCATTALTTSDMSCSARADLEEGDCSPLRPTMGTVRPPWCGTVPPKGQVRGVIDRLDDLLTQHTKLTKQITALWENVIKMIHVSTPSHPTISSPRKNQNKEGISVTVLGSEKQKVEKIPATSKGWKKENGEVPLGKRSSAVAPFPEIVSTHSINLGKECDHDDDEENGVEETYKHDKEKMLGTKFATSAPPQVLLCLLLIELVQALLKWLKILSQHLSVLQVASESFSAAGRLPFSASLSLSQRGTTSKVESTADPFPRRSSTRRSPPPVGTLPPTFVPSVSLQKIPPSPAITSTCSNPSTSERFSSLARDCSCQASYVSHSCDHPTSSSFTSDHPKVFVPSFPSSSFPFPSHHESTMDFDRCGNVVLLTLRGVLKRMRGLLMVLWNEYLKEDTLTASDVNATKNIPTSLECNSKPASSFSSLSLLSRILSPSTLVTILFLIWKAVSTTSELTMPLQEISVVFHEMALQCSSAHLRNVYHIFCKELNHWKCKEGDAASTCKGAYGHKMDRIAPTSCCPPSLDDRSSFLDDKRLFWHEEGSTCFSRLLNDFIFRFRRNSKCCPHHSFCINSLEKEEEDVNAKEHVVPYLLDLLHEADAAAGDQQHLVGAALWELAEVRETLMDREAQVKYLQSCVSEKGAQFSAEREALQGQIWRLSELLSSTASSQRTSS